MAQQLENMQVTKRDVTMCQKWHAFSAFIPYKENGYMASELDTDCLKMTGLFGTTFRIIRIGGHNLRWSARVSVEYLRRVLYAKSSVHIVLSHVHMYLRLYQSPPNLYCVRTLSFEHSSIHLVYMYLALEVHRKRLLIGDSVKCDWCSH